MVHNVADESLQGPLKLLNDVSSLVLLNRSVTTLLVSLISNF